MKLEPFTKELLQQLKKQGYTHIQQRGIADKKNEQPNDAAGPADDYILVPWKKDVLQFEEANLQLLEIDSTDVSDMLGLEFGIYFYVEMPGENLRGRVSI